MARRARVVVPNYPHHITQRGNRRQTTFFSDHDYQTYLRLLADNKISMTLRFGHIALCRTMCISLQYYIQRRVWPDVWPVSTETMHF